MVLTVACRPQIPELLLREARAESVGLRSLIFWKGRQRASGSGRGLLWGESMAYDYDYERSTIVQHRE
jgi:hypothetical protein